MYNQYCYTLCVYIVYNCQRFLKKLNFKGKLSSGKGLEVLTILLRDLTQSKMKEW